MEALKELRTLTQAPMSDCHRSLLENDNKLEEALKSLKVSVLEKVKKKADRVAAEGLIGVATVRHPGSHRGVLLEVNCETDFSSKNFLFETLTENSTRSLLATATESKREVPQETLLKLPVPSMQIVTKTQQKPESEPLSEAVNNVIFKLGENVVPRRAAQLVVEKGVVVGYAHGGSSESENMGRIGVLVGLHSSSTNQEQLQAAAHQLAVHVATRNIQYMSKEDVPAAILEAEKKKRKEKFEETFLRQVCLMDSQISVAKENEETEEEGDGEREVVVSEWLKEKEKDIGKVKVEFVYFRVGQGIKKQSSDFAAEVKKQMETKPK